MVTPPPATMAASAPQKVMRRQNTPSIRAGNSPAPTIAGLTAGLAPAASGLVGALLGFAAAIVVSLLTAAPGLGRHEVVEAIRRPSPDPILEDHAT